jgi:hypothetical protein
MQFHAIGIVRICTRRFSPFHQLFITAVVCVICYSPDISFKLRTKRIRPCLQPVLLIFLIVPWCLATSRSVRLMAWRPPSPLNPHLQHLPCPRIFSTRTTFLEPLMRKARRLPCCGGTSPPCIFLAVATPTATATLFCPALALLDSPLYFWLNLCSLNYLEKKWPGFWTWPCIERYLPWLLHCLEQCYVSWGEMCR